MAGRCGSCGGRLDDDGTCAACELEPVALDESEVGIRRDDRWVALPPGPVWVRRRTRRESPVGPFVALAAAIGIVALMVVLAPGGARERRPVALAPRLDVPTHTILYRSGPWGTEEFDVDSGTIRSVADIPDGAASGPGTVVDGRTVDPDRTAGVGEWLFVLTRSGTVEVIGGDGTRYRLPLKPRVTHRIAAIER